MCHLNKETGQTYPEMDKLLAMCKIFKCSLDDLTNDEITDVKIEEKKKGNLYTFIDSVLDFINKTYQTCKGMTKNEFLQCFVTMFFVGIILAFFYLPFDAISNFFCSDDWR